MEQFGTAGSTLVSELNRLANGGNTYPERTLYKDAAGAANAWAGTDGLDLLAALNYKAGITNRSEFKGLNAICNYIAGTSGLEAVTALRFVPDIYSPSATWADVNPAETWNTVIPTLSWDEIQGALS